MNANYIFNGENTNRFELSAEHVVDLKIAEKEAVKWISSKLTKIVKNVTINKGKTKSFQLALRHAIQTTFTKAQRKQK